MLENIHKVNKETLSDIKQTIQNIQYEYAKT